MKTSDPENTLTHFTCADLIDPTSQTRFNRTLLKIGNLEGDHDIILGTPFLDLFQLFVSISQ